jgi:hypothetical protein
VNPHRQVDLHGSISACDAAGRTVRIHCEGTGLRIDADTTRAALSALSALRNLRASEGVGLLAPNGLDRLNDFRIELCLRGRLIGRAGLGARAGWLGSALTKLPLELHLLALIRAVLRAF